MPNIITGVLLGAAEAAGSVAVLLFIAGSGEFGIGPLQEVTWLSALVYYSERGPHTFVDVMGDYQFTAALLLVMLTFSFSIAAIVLKRGSAARYRGGISFVTPRAKGVAWPAQWRCANYESHTVRTRSCEASISLSRRAR